MCVCRLLCVVVCMRVYVIMCMILRLFIFVSLCVYKYMCVWVCAVCNLKCVFTGVYLSSV